MKWFFLSLLLLILAVFIFIQTPFGQNWIVKQVTSRFSKDLQTKIVIRKVNFSLFNRMHLNGVLIEDRQGDTLLFADDIKVKITDWFFFKKKAELKYIGLENAVVKLQRSDSVWRHQFILDYFSSPSSGGEKKEGIQFSLKKTELKNVTFLKKDDWTGDELKAHVGYMNMDAEVIGFTGNTFIIRSLLLEEPVVSLKSYAGLKPRKNIPEEENEADDKNQLSWNKGGMMFAVSNLRIVNGAFSTDKETDRPPLPYFDGKHILVTGINGELSNSSFIGDTVFSKLKLSAKERSGFELKEMIADLKMTPQSMAFTNLDITTNKSNIRNSFIMSYNNMDDMGDFIHKVNMSAVFNETSVNSDDIAFFAPALKTWKKEIELNGQIRGTVDALVGRDLLIQAGNNTTLAGDISMTGLPDINQTFIDFTSRNFRTTYGDAVTIIPALRKVTSPDLRKLQYVNFKGSFTGFIHDFVTFGTIQTNLGTVKSDLNMKLPSGKAPAYSGSVSTTDFRLGDFLGDANIGSISMSGKVKGTGFNDKTRNTLFEGDVHYFDYNGYRYQDINVNGTFNKKLFEGFASIRDENADLDLNGIIDFNDATPRFDLVATVDHADLKNLNLLDEDVQVKGHFNFNFTGSDIDNFGGTARITDAEIIKDGTRLPFDSLIASSSINADSSRILTIASNEFNADFKGRFNLLELPNAVTFLLNKYYPAYVKAPVKKPKDQAFHFDISTNYSDDYLTLLFPKLGLGGFNFSNVSGDFDLANNQLVLDADVPHFRFRQYNFNSVNIQALGSGSNLLLEGAASNIQINDSITIPSAAFTVNAHNDSSKINIHSITASRDTANLNALLLTYDDGVKIEFDPSTFTINSKLWTIDESGELEFRSTHPTEGQLVLKSGEQRIDINTVPSVTGGNWNDFKVKLHKINAGDFSPLFLPKNRLEGLITGNILIEDPVNNLKISSNDIETEFLRLDNDSLGQVKATVSYEGATNELKFKGETINQINHLSFDGNLFFGDSAKAVNNIIALKAKDFEIKILERFLGTLFTDIRGYLTGDINVSGEFDNLTVTGKGRLKNAGVKVVFTQCFYKIEDTDIELTSEEIYLGGIVLTDTVTGNPIYIVGGIEHQSFKNMFYNLDITTRKPNTKNGEFNKPVLLLNSTYKDNQQFYGRVIGTGSLSLLGPEQNMYMKIDAVASDKDSSSVTLPPSVSRESGFADFLVEKKYGREMTEADVKGGGSIITYDVDVTANPMVSVRVVLDELTGDEIKGRGAGTLNIRSGTTEPLSLRGRLDIEEGSYLFTFQSFFKKPFELREGVENYIEWNGDPYDAKIKFEATYRAERVSFAPLANSLNINSGSINNARGDVYVVAKLTDQLFRPNISFSLDFPNSSVAVSDPELALIIQQIQKNENELNRQVTYLIVFNSFAPSELAGNYSGPGLGLNTISGILLNVVSDQINKILGNLLKDDKYKISLNTSLYNRNIIDPNNNTALNLGSNVNFSIGRSFFNNRFIISTGVGFDAPLQTQTNTIQQSILLLPDVTLEWLINQSGSVRASFFYRENADYLGTTNANQPSKAKRIGSSISYKKDFNKLGELFRVRRKNTAAKPDADTTTTKEATRPEENE